MKLDVTNLSAGKAGAIELEDSIFGLTPRQDILQRMVVWQLAKRQAGTRKTKGRSEISITKAKFGKQKGGGRARHGQRSAPQFRGGGKAFGPVVRSHAIGLPKKVRALALKHALSSKAQDSNLVVLDEAQASDSKTKGLRASLKSLGLQNVLIVDGAEVDQNLSLAARNIPNVDVLPAHGINVYDILRREKLVLTKSAVEALEARLK
jgi:large subunit ribosomal protein L4